MADDKEIKYIMHYKRPKNSSTQAISKNYFKKSCSFNEEQNPKIVLSKSFYNRQKIYRTLNDVTVIVHRKKKHRSPAMNTIQFSKQYSTPLLNFTYNENLISSKTSISHQDIYGYKHNRKRTVSARDRPIQFSCGKWDVYRCQFSTPEESCCCSCNSDAMFEVMKSLYDCYKKKNCDHCNCILCGHLPREERRLGEQRKSGMLAAVSVKAKSIKKKKGKSKDLLALKEAKTPEEKEAALKKIIVSGGAIPEAKTQSEKDLIAKVKTQLALPPEPRTKSEKELYKKAEAEGLITPLEGKTKAQKAKILERQRDMGLPLPEGRTPSEKALIEKIKSAGTKSASVGVPSEKIRKAKKEGLLTPLEGKSPEQKEKILKGLAMNGIPLPKGKSDSERKLINKVRDDLGLPPEPQTASDKKNYKKALAAGLIVPLEGKSRPEKEDLLRKQAAMGLPLPKGRTASEKSLIAKIQKTTGARPSISAAVKVPSEKIKKAKAAGLLTPLEGKTPKQKEEILRGLAMHGIPLPEGKSDSDRKLINKIRADLGLPPEPKTAADKKKYNQALAAGIITPLEGKTPARKEDILRKQAAMGLPLPEGRTASEKAIIAKIKQEPPLPSEVLKVPSEKIKKAKAAGLLTPLEGKPPKRKEEILKGLAMHGIPLPEGKSDSERKLIDKVRADLGLPPEPKTASEKSNYNKALAAGVITPLEGKTPAQKEDILRKQAAMGLPLPQGRTPSEKALIAKVQQTAPSPLEVGVSPEKIKKAKAAGLLTPLEGKTPKRKEEILKGLAKHGIPLPEGKSDSERKLIDKVRADLGLPPEPKTASEKSNYNKALAAGVITPLEGKTPAQKEDILRKQAAMGLPLPQGRTPSEKALIAKVQQTAPSPLEVGVSPEKIKKAKAAGLLTPLEGKTPKRKEEILKGLAKHGIPLPEGKSDSERKLIDKVRADLGLPPEPKTASEKSNYNKALAAGVITPLEGKTPTQKEDILRKQAAMGLPLPQGRTPSEKALIAKVQQTAAAAPPPSEMRVPSAKLRKAKAAGLLTPLEGKTPKQKEDILRGLAMNGIPLPHGKTDSDQKLIDKIRNDLGLPPEPKTSADKNKYKKALAAGVITPLEGKTPAQKEDILRKQAAMGLPLPQGRTASEKALIAKIQQEPRPPSGVFRVPSEKMKKAKAAGLLTPLEGKSSKRKEEILKGLAMQGIPLPEGKSDSERKLIDKVRADLGLPPEPKTASEKSNYNKALAAGVITPLEGKTPAQKEDILRKQAAMGLPLPQGRTPSEKALIAKVQQTAAAAPPPSEMRVPSAKLRKAKAAGLLTPLEGKTPKQKEDILRGLAMNGIPLPHGKTDSDQKLIDKVRNDLGLPPEPKTSADKNKYKKALAAGVITPLEGKTPAQKEDILRKQAAMGLPLPQGRTPSEKALIAKVQQTAPSPLEVGVSPEKIKKAKAAGLLTPLEGKTPKRKEEILKGLAKHGIPLPEGKSDSERKLIDKVRADLGLPPEPKTASEKSNYNKALAAGIITPLEGKSPAQKEEILRKQAAMGLPLPEGRTASEKALVAKVKKATPPAAALEEEPTARGLPPAEKEKTFKNLAMQGRPLPEARSPSEEKILSKVRQDLGLPPEPKTSADKEKYNRALAAGIIVPLEGKSRPEKERILQAQADMGIPLPEGRTGSEKSIIRQIKSGKRKSLAPVRALPPSKPLPPAELKKLDAKTAKKMKEGKGPSDECICDILTPEAEKMAIKSRVPSEKIKRAKEAGLLTPLEGKSAKDKERILKSLAKEGLPLPEPKTASEKKLIEKVKTEMGVPAAATPSEKLRKAKATGLLTPLEGISPKEKEKILRSLAKEGLPLPEPKTASEKKLIEKVKTELGMPPTTSHSEKIRKAKAAGLLTPLEGKSPKEKERILRSLAKEGLPLPEPKTPSEKKLMDKVKTELGIPVEGIPSEKLRKARAAGLITPLEGKPQAQKEKILKGRVAAGLPLPEGVTPSDKELIKKIRAETGYVTPRAVKSKSRVTKIPSEKLKAAKAAGLLTPLQGKSDAQKEKILKGLVANGIPLPKGKTPSEKKIIDKVRKDLGLPPEPKSPSIREKYRQAQDSGFITPLEGKTPAQKEKILRKQAEMGIPLPEGRTPSEKDLINKVRATSAKPVASEKLRKAKEAGLLTPLQGKTPKEKEKILKGLAKTGMPLPEGKTPSEKELIKKVKADMGIPLEGISSDKLRKAMAEGLITPLEGKSAAQKEKLLRGRAQAGLPLPEGVTPSDKELIKKVKAETGYVTPRPEKSKRVSAAAYPSKGLALSPTQKEKALKDLVMQGKPLPEPKTPSEEKIVNKVRHDLGLPPEPKTSADKEKYNRALAAGIIVPLEGKSRPEKERILQAQADMGIPLPEGRTGSEKSIIRQIKSGKRKSLAPVRALPPSKPLPPAELKKLDAKTAKKMKEGKGPSDECICDILTPEAEKMAIKTRVPSEKLRRAKEAGLLTPLEGKSAKDKERILKSLAKEGLPLPEPKTASEKKLIEKVKTEMGVPAAATPSEKLRKAKETGLLTPLEGKSAKEKERILRSLAKEGLLPEPKTASDKKLIDKVKTEMGMPAAAIPSEKLRKAKEAGLLTPLEGKSAKEKERILRSLAKEGLPLPEPKTASEKKLIDKVKTEMGMPAAAIPSEKLRKAKEAGLLTPLEGKSDKDKERILRSLAKEGLPLPEPKTASEKKLIDKVKTEMGMPVAAIPSEKMRKAKAEGLLTPIRGKPEAEKERILRGLAQNGIPLPKGETPSEKKIIDKVRKDLGLPPEPKTPSIREKYNKAQEVGIITPLEGKSLAQKEKILAKQAEMGLPLPEGRTPSEKDLIKRIRESVPKKKKSEVIGEIGGVPVTESKKEAFKKAKAEGLITPLRGKSAADKERIVRGLAEAGLPMPEAATPSDKALIEKVRTALGLPPEPTPSERKEKIKTKSKKIGVERAKKSEIGVGKSKVGITEEFQDIVKTTTCDRGCGCDRKKIRFKHSYVKIRVTSPDISSLCPCPDECVPGVKGGVFTDNEGIKVTVGQVSGIPSFTSKECDSISSKNNVSNSRINSGGLITCNLSGSALNGPRVNDTRGPKISNIEKGKRRKYVPDYDKDYIHLRTFSKSDTFIFIKSLGDLHESKLSVDIPILLNGIGSSFFSSASDRSILSNTISIISISVTDCSSNSAYLIERKSMNSIRSSEVITDTSITEDYYRRDKSDWSASILNNNFDPETDSDMLCTHPAIFRLSAHNLKHDNKNVLSNELLEFCNVNRTKARQKLVNVISNMLSERTIRESSSLYVLLPTSSEDDIVKNLNERQISSTICIQLSEKPLNCRACYGSENHTERRQNTLLGFKIAAKGRTTTHKKEKGYIPPTTFDEPNNVPQRSFYIKEARHLRKEMSTDTTVDRPCCCDIRNTNINNETLRKRQQTEKSQVVSEIVTPFIINDAISQGFSHENYDNIPKTNVVYTSRKLCVNQTPVRLCKIPPCSNFSDCHTPKNIPNTSSVTNVPHMGPMCPNTINTPNFTNQTNSSNTTTNSNGKQCDCDFDKIKEIIEKIGKELISTGCGTSDSMETKNNIKPIIRKTNFEDSSKSLDCLSCGKPSSKEDQKKQCPCERHVKLKSNDFSDPAALDDANYEGFRSNYEEFKDSGKKKKKKNKRHTCECPPAPLEEEFDPILWIDEKQIRKMKSDLTQNTSGFKINRVRRPAEPEMSFEEALSYVIQSDEEKYRRLLCLCEDDKKKSNKKKVDCECPPAPPPPEIPPEEEPKGIKLHIGAKGSSSKGLSGVLCF
ncbi:unnamed protein product [Leptosia nina]|uniref:Uncharacterized protein n=1 Tax=Leptosia nina TaxID=320188 RepID=A0AAV1K0M5_9NEOP